MITEQEKRVKIALSCGWKLSTVSPERHPDWVCPPENDPHLCGGPAELNVPNYFESLEEMHKAEQFLTDNEQKHQYASYLGRHDYWTLIHATAAQRAEAFGKTLALW